MSTSFPQHFCSEPRFISQENLGYELCVYPEDIIIHKHDGKWWMRVSEYVTPIIYCPFCGVKLN